jgi:predicted Zn-dependent peptidase
MRPALDMLMRVIDDGMSTRLYHRLCDARGLCYDVSAGYDPYEDDGVVDVAAGVQHKRVPLVTREILGLFEDLARSGPTDEELAKARRRVLWDARSMRDSAEEMGSFYAGGLLFDRQTTPEEHVAALVAVTPSDVREVARWMVRPERLSVTAVGLPDGDQDTALEDVVDGWRAP